MGRLAGEQADGRGKEDPERVREFLAHRRLTRSCGGDGVDLPCSSAACDAFAATAT